MSRKNAIQQAIKALSGGEYQKFMDTYLYKKFKYDNIEPLGSHTGTNKVTKGIPDSYVKLGNGNYILIMYGSVESISYDKLKKDIKSCLDKDKLDLDIKRIEEIICCYTSTNIHIEQKEELEKLIDGVKITLVGLGTVSEDLVTKYPFIATDLLSIPIDTNQIFDIEDFVSKHNQSSVSAPINEKLIHREKEIDSLLKKLEYNDVILLYGRSGVGKTALALEVAKIYREMNNTSVFCIKNNGQILYEDLRFYLSDAGEYLLIVDDANEITKLEHVLNYIVNPPEKVKVKIIMTVRDYAKSKVKYEVYRNIKPVEEEIDILSNDAIKEILESNLGIKNQDYLYRITKIAKGNPRLAILAGTIAWKKGFAGIQNAIDIFKYYYERIINEELSDRKKLLATFTIVFFGPFEYKKSDVARKFLYDSGISEEEFYEICCELNELEIIDFYMNRAVKIGDQSLGDYLLYYILIEKQYIKLSIIIKECFGKYTRQIVYAIQTILALFNNDKCIEYVKSEVNLVWESMQDNFGFIKVFHIFNEEKTLLYVKKAIDNKKIEEVILDKSSFKDKSNSKDIKSELVELLGEFKYSDNYETVLELILYYFKRRPIEALDIYHVLTDKLGYDRYSYSNGYSIEVMNIERLINNVKSDDDVNLALLLLSVIKDYLKFETTQYEANGYRNVNIFTITLNMCEGLKDLRLKIWSILGELYNDKRYKEYIQEILLDYRPYSRNKEVSKGVYEIDLKFAEKYIFKEFDLMDFNECKVLRHFEELNEMFHMEIDSILARYKENKEFEIYNTLSKSHKPGQDWEKEEIKKDKKICKMVENYTKEDFVRLFKICNKVYKQADGHEIYEVGKALDIIFDNIKDKYLYKEAIEAYLEYNTPFNNYIKDKVYNLIKLIGIDETEKVIFSYDYGMKNGWIFEFLVLIPYKKREVRYAKMLRKAVEEELKKENPRLSTIYEVGAYKEFDQKIIVDIAEGLINHTSKNKDYTIENFLGIKFDKENVDRIMTIFDGDMEVLEDLYLSITDKNIDYKGNLFINLVKNNNKFLVKFIKNKLDLYNTNLNTEIFERLWEQNNYKELIGIVFKTVSDLQKQDRIYIREYNLENLFINNKDTTIKEKKVDWIKDYIKNNLYDEEKLTLIFYIAQTTVEDVKELILYFLTLNKDIEMFKAIPLAPRSISWSGSEVPIIESRISFIEDLLKNIKGIDYIEHRAYLQDVVAKKEKYKHEILVSEYMSE